METDGALVARALAGDARAFEELVNRHQPRCLRYARRVLGDHDDADDVIQETFVRAYKALHQCNDPERFGVWVFQILVNRCRSAMERRATQERWFVKTEIDDLVVPSVTEPRELSQGADLEQALSQLGDSYREAIILKYVDQMTYEEMASTTGTSIGALKMRVSRAGAMLRAKLLARR